MRKTTEIQRIGKLRLAGGEPLVATGHDGKGGADFDGAAAARLQQQGDAASLQAMLDDTLGTPVPCARSPAKKPTSSHDIDA